MPEVSVIMPTYNDSQYLSEAIDSVLAQTYQDFELIIIDDGSTDNTSKIVGKYILDGNNKIKYHYQSNQGISAARNAGLKYVNGKYICFLDSDDIMLPQNIELKVRYAKSDNLKLISSDYYRATTSNKNLKIKSDTKGFFRERGLISLIKRSKNYTLKNEFYYSISRLDYLKLALKDLCINTRTVFIETAFLLDQERASFDTELVVSEDTDLFRRLLLSSHLGEVGHIDKTLAVYRNDAASWANNPHLERCQFTSISRFVEGFAKYRSYVSLDYYSDCMWDKLWLFKNNKQYRYYFYKKIFLSYPWKFKYWKSFLVQLFKDFLGKDIVRMFREKLSLKTLS